MRHYGLFVNAAQEERTAKTDCHEPGEGPIVVAVVGVIGIGEELIAVAPRDLHEAARLGSLQGPQSHGVVRAKNRGVDADPDRQSEHGDGGEAGTPAKRA